MFALVHGAMYTRAEAAAILGGVELFFRDAYLYGPAGAAHAAGEAVRGGATRDEILTLMRTSIATYRCCRRESVFTFDTSLGNQRAAFAVIARVLFGVARAERR